MPVFEISKTSIVGVTPLPASAPSGIVVMLGLSLSNRIIVVGNTIDSILSSAHGMISSPMPLQSIHKEGYSSVAHPTERSVKVSEVLLKPQTSGKEPRPWEVDLRRVQIRDNCEKHL